MRFRLAALILLLTSSPLYAQWFDLKTAGVPRLANGNVDMAAPVPLTEGGKVDMSGVWVPVDAHGTLFDSSRYQGWAIDTIAVHERNFFGDEPRFSCLPSGPGSYPAGASVGGTRRIVQSPEYIAVLNSDMSYRQVWMDGRELEDKPILPTWMGFSTGHWEGDVLVIESNGYKATTWLTREGVPHTEQLRITERYHRHDYGHITLEVSYDDPGTFTGPVQATIALENRPDNSMLEVICNESETGQSFYGGEIAEAEANVVTVPTEILENYLGTYEGIWLGNLIRAEVVLEDEELYLIRTPRYSDTGGNTDSAKSLMIPLSDTAFECTCGLGFVFVTDDTGRAVAVDEVHVSGRWPFDRVD